MAQLLADTSYGDLTFDSNELSISSKVDDPPKLRLAAPEGISSGAVSFNRRINGQHRENVLFQGKQDERFRHDPLSPASEFTLHLNNGESFEDAAMKAVMEIRCDTFEILGVKFTQEQLLALRALVGG